MKAITKISIVFLVIVLIMSGGSLFAYKTYHELNSAPVGLNNEAHIILIEEGQTLYSMAYILEDMGLIKDSRLFKVISKLNSDRNLQKGAFEVVEGMSCREIFDHLTTGDQIQLKITIPEGKTMWQVAQILEDENLADADEILRWTHNQDLIDSYSIPFDTLDGYLYPDTYFIPYGFSERNIVKMMVDNLFMQLDVIYPEWEDLSSQELHEYITLASIIEKEYRVEEEAPLISSVFHNRLNSENVWENRLDSCATILYVITAIEGLPQPDRILYSDLERESPYNTYKNKGLPPGPISNAGYVSLDAVFHPADTDYFYFVVKDPAAGTHNFSASFEDHSVGKREYIVNYQGY